MRAALSSYPGWTTQALHWAGGRPARTEHRKVRGSAKAQLPRFYVRPGRSGWTPAQ